MSKQTVNAKVLIIEDYPHKRVLLQNAAGGEPLRRSEDALTPWHTHYYCNI
jgi:hypothetical protein